MLIAQIADSNSTAAGASMIACAMAALSGLFAWLSRRDQLRSDRETARDKLEHDTRIVQQDAEIESLKHQHADCERAHIELKAEIAALRRRIDDMTGQYRPLPPAAA
jgi:septal ring factor EnvC (AmiA/AmiB activator)